MARNEGNYELTKSFGPKLSNVISGCNNGGRLAAGLRYKLAGEYFLAQGLQLNIFLPKAAATPVLAIC